MRKTMRMEQIFLLAGFLFFCSCKKNAEEITITDNMSSTNELMTKVNAWLEEKQASYTDGRSLKIDSLKKELVSSRLTVEDYNQNEKLVIVPVGEGFKSVNNTDRNPKNYLVMILSGGTITKGNLIQYINPEDKNQLQQNTFSRIFTYQKLGCNGVFDVLSITDGFVYELTFEGGGIKSVTDRQKKSTEKSQGKTDGCIDWYLITTWYNADGGVDRTTEQYLWTSCDDRNECNSTRMISNRNFRTACGGSGPDIDYEYEVRRPVSWIAYTTTDSYSAVWSHEMLIGTRSTSGVAKFTDINYHTDEVHTTVVYNPAYAEWHRYDWNFSIAPDKKTATTNLTGKLTFPNKTSAANIVIPPASKNWVADTEL